MCFAFPLKALLEIGVNPPHWLDDPAEVIPDICAALSWTKAFDRGTGFVELKQVAENLQHTFIKRAVETNPVEHTETSEEAEGLNRLKTLTNPQSDKTTGHRVQAAAVLEEAVGALKRHIQTLPDGVMRSPTWSRGIEMTQYNQITLATNVDIHISDPQSPSWQITKAIACRAMHGNEVLTKTLIVCCANTFQRKPT